MRTDLLGGILRVILILLAQVLLFKNLVLYDQAFCFAYVMLFLVLPIDTNRMVQLMIALVIGLTVDMFYNTLGIHAAASIFMVYARMYWVRIVMPTGGYDSMPKINVRTQGLDVFVTYAFPLIWLHTLLLFFIEAAGFTMFLQTLGKAFYSALFTMVVILIIQYLFYKKMK